MSQPATPWFSKAAQVSSFLIKNATRYLFYWYDCVQKKFMKTKYIRFSNEYLNESRYSYKWNIFVIFLGFCYSKFVILFKKLKLYYSETVSVMRAAINVNHTKVYKIEQKIRIQNVLRMMTSTWSYLLLTWKCSSKEQDQGNKWSPNIWW